ncbi:hypothetical protein F1542_01555, partial [Komagataeibacter sp. FXV3]|nr:hypothetical protein [Komagataeibacter sp. FXV3]
IVVPVAGAAARDGMVVRRHMYMTVMVTPCIPATMVIPMAGSWVDGGGVAGKAIPACFTYGVTPATGLCTTLRWTGWRTI